ncbi:hypothetical protein N7533_010806 [Penicillium manginii]|uniref:uncharacterized protein n=1 Tax=Penicillium manginii TaxID=203109 RepID=UPI002547B4F0|nr:uncharacterized protein N7533_010806 [Penicillium manginii]KAJ5741397.1 hypothetical protein N7533_010806 [Penicillium manginii]
MVTAFITKPATVFISDLFTDVATDTITNYHTETVTLSYTDTATATATDAVSSTTTQEVDVTATNTVSRITINTDMEIVTNTFSATETDYTTATFTTVETDGVTVTTTAVVTMLAPTVKRDVVEERAAGATPSALRGIHTTHLQSACAFLYFEDWVSTIYTTKTLARPTVTHTVTTHAVVPRIHTVYVAKSTTDFVTNTAPGTLTTVKIGTVTIDITTTRTIPTTLIVTASSTTTATDIATVTVTVDNPTTETKVIIATVTSDITTSTTLDITAHETASTSTITVDVTEVATLTATSSFTVTATVPVTVETTILNTVEVTNTATSTSTIDVTITQTVSTTTTTTVTSAATSSANCNVNVISNPNFDGAVLAPWVLTKAGAGSYDIPQAGETTAYALELYSTATFSVQIVQVVITSVGQAYAFSLDFKVTIGTTAASVFSCSFDNSDGTTLTIPLGSVARTSWLTRQTTMVASSTSTTITCMLRTSFLTHVYLDNISLAASC